MSAAASDLRRFARTFTRAAGLLRGRLYDVDLSLTEARILYEIAAGGVTTADAARTALGLDKGYLSRTIAGLERRGWVARRIAPDDRRARVLSLTAAGQALFARIDERSTKEMEAMIAHLGAAERRRLGQALTTAERLLAREPPAEELLLRSHRAGDMGRIIARHGELYMEEHGWDATFEGAVAEIGAAFLQAHDPRRECCLIAEIGGEMAGSAAVVRIDDATAKLRIVYVEPWARGRGVGETLVTACLDFARSGGYARMKLWTNDVLKPARRLYERLGFSLVESAPHRSFGVDLVGEVWERAV
jgi:DNA-binding MarR family transcriptional regulator/predicted GNAT family acetyltransferase